MRKLLHHFGLCYFKKVHQAGANDYYECSICGKRTYKHAPGVGVRSPVAWNWVNGLTDDFDFSKKGSPPPAPVPAKTTYTMREQHFIRHGFKKKWNDDLSASWWQKKIKHPLFEDLRIIVEDDWVFINCVEYYEGNTVTVMASDDTSTANISDILDVIYLGKNGFNDKFFVK